MGTGRVLKQAIIELKALPEAALERSIALPILLRLRFTIPAEPGQRTSDDQEFLMSTEDAYEFWERQVREKGVREGLERGLERGLAKGLVTCYEARFGSMPSDLRALIEATRDEATLQLVPAHDRTLRGGDRRSPSGGPFELTDGRLTTSRGDRRRGGRARR